MTAIDIDAIPLDDPEPRGAKVVEADRSMEGLTPCRCVDCDHRVDLGDRVNGCEAHPVEAHRDIRRRRYCADFKPMRRTPNKKSRNTGQPGPRGTP